MQLAVDLFRARCLETTPLQKCGRRDAYHVVAPHDGVPSSLNPHDLHKNPSDAQLDKNILHRRLIIERHHETVKGIYDFCLKNEIEDVRVMSGGGRQLQVFFGQPNKYLGILYLTMDSPSFFVPAGYLKAIGNEMFTLVLERDEFAHIFEDLAVPGVKVTIFGSGEAINRTAPDECVPESMQPEWPRG